MTDNISNVDLSTVGTILLVVGVIGLLLSLVFIFARRRTEVIHEDERGYVRGRPRRTSARTTYVEDDPRDPMA